LASPIARAASGIEAPVRDTLAKIRCTPCRQQLSKKRPSVPTVMPKSSGKLGKVGP
jgi:hypothetical protein